MPFKNNYGYWIDNNLVLDDFRKLFTTIEISKGNLREVGNYYNANSTMYQL